MISIVNNLPSCKPTYSSFHTTRQESPALQEEKFHASSVLMVYQINLLDYIQNECHHKTAKNSAVLTTY